MSEERTQEAFPIVAYYDSTSGEVVKAADMPEAHHEAWFALTFKYLADAERLKNGK